MSPIEPPVGGAAPRGAGEPGLRLLGPEATFAQRPSSPDGPPTLDPASEGATMLEPPVPPVAARGQRVRRDRSPDTKIGFNRARVWGTTVTLAVQPAHALARARQLLDAEVEATDRSCNRFRPDSELSRLNRANGRPIRVSPNFLAAIETALFAAQRTDGAVDPTVGEALVALGYDRDFDQVASAPSTEPLRAVPRPSPGWWAVRVDRDRRTVTLPPGVQLDLGATAKAVAADRAAATIARTTGASVLVDLGGDLAVAGPPPVGGWRVGVVEDVRSPSPSGECVVAVWGGGMASSGTTARRWSRSGWPLHHIIDPATGWPARPVWKLVTVAAGSCLDANCAATAAVVWGEAAPFRIAQLGLPARFVRPEGGILEVGGWPVADGRGPNEHAG